MLQFVPSKAFDTHVFAALLTVIREIQYLVFPQMFMFDKEQMAENSEQDVACISDKKNEKPRSNTYLPDKEFVEDR